MTVELKKIGPSWYRLDGESGFYASIRRLGPYSWGVAVRSDRVSLDSPEETRTSRAAAVARARKKLGEVA